ncbi:MAG: potassium transporter TrkG, partial [Cyanobacteria bacterium J06607_6]
MGFRGNLFINFVVTVLSIFGAIGFIVVSDIWLSFKNSDRQITLTTKIILYSTFSVLIFGWVYLFFADASMTELPLGERLLSSWFQSMTAMTTVGFNTHPIENLVASSVLLMLILMIIGASPSGTGGGLKTTSVSAAIGAVWATLRGQPDVTISQRRIPVSSLTSAFAAVMFYLLMFLAGSLCLLMLQGQAFEDVLFEAASALGTVGLSRGITGDLTPLGKLVVIVLMFIGRVGPMTFGLALFKQPVKDLQLDEEDIAL